MTSIELISVFDTAARIGMLALSYLIAVLLGGAIFVNYAYKKRQRAVELEMQRLMATYVVENKWDVRKNPTSRLAFDTLKSKLIINH